MITKTKNNLTDQRTYFKPFNYPWAYDAWLKHEQAHWLHTEVPMAEDVKDWKKKLKTLYYCRSEKIGKADKVSKKIERQVIKELDMTQIAQGNDCIACEG